MTVVTRLLYGAMGAALAVVTPGLTTSTLPILALLPILLGLLWGVGQWRDWRWSASFVMAGLAIAAAAGVLAGAAPVLMLLGMVASLATWDLEHFLRRAASVKRVEGATTLAYAHIRRLGLVLILGLLLSLPALVLRVQLDLGWAIVLGLLAVISLGQAVRLLRRASD